MNEQHRAYPMLSFLKSVGYVCCFMIMYRDIMQGRIALQGVHHYLTLCTHRTGLIPVAVAHSTGPSTASFATREQRQAPRTGSFSGAKYLPPTLGLACCAFDYQLPGRPFTPDCDFVPALFSSIAAQPSTSILLSLGISDVTQVGRNKS